jgi:hypothetical protein
MIEFKKTGVAAAVAGALLAVSGIAQAAILSDGRNAVILSAPDDVMLVPYVLCNKQATLADTVNTLVGLTTIFPNRDLITTSRDFRPERQSKKPTSGAFVGKVHWRWYNTRSEHKLDGIIDVTDNDFVRFDWCSILEKSGKLAELNGKPGYLLFHADSLKFNTANNILIGNGLSVANSDTYSRCAESTAGCTLAVWRGLNPTGAAAPFDTSVLKATGYVDGTGVPLYNFDQRIWLYGHSYMIQGDWASQAFIPILTAPTWDTVVRGGYPAIERLWRGIDFTYWTPGLPYQDVVMRYFLDPALAKANSMVFWFNSNQAIRGAVPLETFDSEQVYQYSYTTGLPDELNIILSTPTAPAFPGMIHTETEANGATVVNTGLVNVYVPQVNSTVQWLSSGVAFNMLALGAPANAAQVQTEMATASADLLGPF